jgi:hypothetical protein
MGENVRFIVTCEEGNRVHFPVRERVEWMEREIEQMRLLIKSGLVRGRGTVTSFSKRGISYFVAIRKSSSQLSFVNKTCLFGGE